MKRTGIKKLELKKLTVQQLTEVAGGGCRIQTRFCSGTCNCATSGRCNTTQPGHALDDNSYQDCDYVALGLDGCDGGCRADDSSGGGGGGGGCGGGCGGHMEMQKIAMY